MRRITTKASDTRWAFAGDLVGLEVATVPISAPEELAGELAGLLPSGATTGGLRECQALLGLALVHAKSATGSTDDRAAALQGLLTEAAVRVDGVRDGTTAALLGLARGYRGSLLKTRRAQAAALLNVGVDHFRKEREEGLLEALADELYALDAAFRLRHRHRMEGERRPEESALRIDWLAQHRSYRRIWTPVTGMRNDLIVLLCYLRGTPGDRPGISDRLSSLTWFYARFLRELERFVEREGGLWLLADAESEERVSSAIYSLGFNTPFGEADDSWFRLLLRQAEAEELDPFTDLLIAAGEPRRELMAAWMEWAGSCSGDLGRDDPGCEVHAWFSAAEEFIRLIDEDWLRVADWYRAFDIAPFARAMGPVHKLNPS